jgi:pyruvate/2-oxoglutarate dehydrogenase complex dihydrolipoamide acyltransferase (E2) component
MSKRLLVVNVVLVGLAVFFAFALARALTHSRSLPSPPAPRRVTAAVGSGGEAAESSVAAEKLANYNVIAAKHLFNPSRTEGGAAAAAATPTTPPPPKPILLGVLVDGARSRAYLEDPATKRVFGYQVGDTVSGGRLDQITDDKVVIVRPDGAMDVLLRDPAKPRPAPPPAAASAPGTPAPTAPTASTPQQPATPGSRLENALTGRPAVPPRAVRQARPGLPPEQPQGSPQQ